MQRTTTFAVLGTGMQGAAAAYDLLTTASGSRLLLLDGDLARANAARDHLCRLVPGANVETRAVDALDAAALTEALTGVDVLLSCVPFWMHPQVAAAAIAAGTSMCDLGGNTDVTRQTLALDEAARHAGVTLVPDCGLAPGLVVSLGLEILENLPGCERIALYCGVLPQNPQPPLNYKLTFHVEGLVTEYDHQAVVLRDGEVTEVRTLGELETLQVPRMGEMEAFVTSGGVSTAPETLRGRLSDFGYKTLRFPGHAAAMRLFRDFGLWREDEIEVPGGRVRPKDVFCRVFGEALGAVEDRDRCAVVAQGWAADGSTRRLDLYVEEDERTGRTAMAQTTGDSISIVAQAVARGEVARGAVRYEDAMTGTAFVAALRERGFEIAVS